MTRTHASVGMNLVGCVFSDFNAGYKEDLIIWIVGKLALLIAHYRFTSRSLSAHYPSLKASFVARFHSAVVLLCHILYLPPGPKQATRCNEVTTSSINNSGVSLCLYYFV